jgi:perosamine synthetase
MSSQAKLPVHEPDIGEAEIASVVAALRRGEISGSFGSAIPEFEEKFAAYCGCKYGIACTSGTTALHLAIDVAGISAGDEVLVSASTNIASALAVYHKGAVTVPVDSEPITWNLDPNLIEGLITPRTRAIMPVHLFGHPCQMDRIGEIAERFRLKVIEDCAEAHGATYHGKRVGGFGDLGCFSFYANKVITTGEGGMVVTNDAQLAERSRLLRNLGFGKPRFYHEVPGYNFRMTGYQAAMGLAQIARIDDIIATKRRIAQTYCRMLAGVPGLQLPAEASGAMSVYWMFAVAVDPSFGISRDELARRLASAGIETRTFFCPMNQQPFLRAQSGYRAIACPVADRLWQSGLYLPSSNRLSEADIARVSRAVIDAGRHTRGGGHHWSPK